MISIKLQISSIFLALIIYGCTQSGQSEIFGFSENYPQELQQLHQNVLINIFDDPTDMEAVENLLDDLNEDGSWSYIDYTSQEMGAWQPREHLTNILNIARAYQNRTSDFYQKITVSEKIHRALNYWLENDFICPNWWYPVIGVPLVLNPIMILMEPELSPDQIEKAMVVLNRCEIGRTGQNKVWQSGNVLLTSLLVKDAEMVRKASESIQEELVVSMAEGVQPDWSYHQHGPQIQFGNYGLSYVGDMIKWISILRNTPYQFDESKVYILRNYLLDGQQWILWKNQMDISACGRQLFDGSPAIKASVLSRSINKMRTLDPEFEEDYVKANDYTNLLGNKHFWRSDFQVQRTPEYFFSVKMCSRRVIGAESCNLENIQGYYMGDGATYLYQSGKEYEDIFPFWDWKKIPGITAHQDNDTLPVLTARGYRIESDFVGGVSDGENGIAAMKYNRNGLTAQKSWFMFQGRIVCLGAGVSSSEGLPVSTSVNQSFLNGEVLIKAAGIEKIAAQAEVLIDPDWILHDQIGYLFPRGGKLKLEAKNVEGSWNWVARRYPDERIKSYIFKLWFAHGLNPTDQSYAYILVPNASKSVLEEMEKQAPFTILNEKHRQEVISSDGSMAGVVFYQAGKSAVFGGIEVDKACLILLKKQYHGMQVSVADPTQQLSEINVLLNGKSGDKTLKIMLPQGGEAGKTVTVDF